MNTNDKALDIILQHTASAEWEDVADMNWTTAEVQELMSKALQQVNGVNSEKLKALPIYVVRVSTWDDAAEGEKAPFIERAAELTRDTLFCSRVWSAWGYGTMTENDFSDTAEDDDFIDAVAKAIWEGY